MSENIRDMTLNLIVSSQVGKIKEFNKELKNTQQGINWVTKGLRRLFLTYFSFKGIQNIVNTYRKLDLIRQSLNGLAGGAEAGARQFEYLRKEAFRTATDFTTIASKYRNFYAAAKGAGFGEAQTQSMFSGLLTAGRALGADKTSIGGALLAVEQMLSKGKVTMEELRRQLGNAYAGAIQVAARAMGVVPEQFEELIRKGISSREFVPKLTAQFEKEFKAGLKEAVKSLDAEMIKLGNAWQYLILKLGDSGAGREFAGVVRQITNILSSPKLIYSMTIIGRTLNYLLRILQIVIKNLGTILFLLSPTIIGASIVKLIEVIKSLILWINATNKSLLLTQRFLIQLYIGFLLLDEVIALFQKGRKSVIKEALFGEDISMGQQIVNWLSIITLSLWGLYRVYRLFGGKSIFNGLVNWANKGKNAGTIAEGSRVAKGSLIDRMRNMANEGGKASKGGKWLKNLKWGGANVGVRATASSILGDLNPLGFAYVFGQLANAWDNRYGKKVNVAQQLKEYDKLKNISTSISATPEPFLTSLFKGRALQLDKTETFAPNITYNPDTKIIVQGSMPQDIIAQIRQYLDERDKNFWTSLVNPAASLKPSFFGGSNK